MAAIDFSELFDTMKSGVVELAKGTLKDYASQATEEGQNALNEMKEDIQSWSRELANGDLGVEDVKFLLAGRKELTGMKALEQLGVAQIQLDKFKSGLMSLIIESLKNLI